jgi:hypothetical protein
MVATKSPQISIARPPPHPPGKLTHRLIYPANSPTPHLPGRPACAPSHSHIAPPRLPGKPPQDAVQHRTQHPPGKDVKLRFLPPSLLRPFSHGNTRHPAASTRQTFNAMHKVQVPRPPRRLPVKPRPPETHHPLQNPGQARYSNGREISHKSSPRWLTLSRS